MKIAIFTDTYLPQVNGVVTFLQDSIRILSKSHEIVVFAPGKGPHRIEQQEGGVTVHWIPSTGFPLYEGYRMASINYKRVSDMLKKEKPDIVHVHAPVILGLEGIIAAKRSKIPIVITYHTHFPDYVFSIMKGKLPSVFGKISAFTVKKMISHVFRMADIVTAPTMELVAELSSYGLENVVYLPNGIDFSKFEIKDFTAEDQDRFRAGLGISGRRMVLYAGRISFEKRLDIVLEAFRWVDEGGAVLVIVGSGPHLNSLKALSKDLSLDNVIFTGFVDQRTLASFYKCADIFVSASDTETFGLTFIEAMDQGVPVIGVNKLGAKEVIDDGKSGLLAEPGSASSLAVCMKRLLEHESLRKRMGRNAKIRARKFTIEESIRKTVLIYQDAVHSHAKKAAKAKQRARKVTGFI